MQFRLWINIIFLGLLFSTCKKEYSCEDCLPKPPVAIAGADTVLYLPADSLILDGTASHDPDGKIVSFKWQKIEGSASFTIANTKAAKTLVKGLAEGVYQFELEVIDDDGLTAKDTLIVGVEKSLNAPPVACARPDTMIVLPVNEVILDGTCSTDPDNDISSYKWARISGPGLANIVDPSSSQTRVSGLSEGTYRFELKVTDATGMSSTDTVNITVQPANLCNSGKRMKIIAHLTPIGHLSQARSRMAVASAGQKILFAGGNKGGATSRVDIFDIGSLSWSSHELSVPRFLSTAVVAGTKVFFAGGLAEGGVLPTSAVDIFDVTSNSWTTAQLSIPGFSIGAAALDNKVIFAGGDGGGTASARDRRVDIYDLSTNQWSTASLSVRTRIASAIAVNNKIYIAGGEMENHCNVPGGSNWSYPSRVMDVYDNGSSSWSTL
ncbi:MAG TPA: hypothetical protein VEZ55_16380, partial [Chitinophagaceae bacterium]|nr:hypothetical protein [Chitinophagaceae bacterium]